MIAKRNMKIKSTQLSGVSIMAASREIVKIILALANLEAIAEVRIRLK